MKEVGWLSLAGLKKAPCTHHGGSCTEIALSFFSWGTGVSNPPSFIHPSKVVYLAQSFLKRNERSEGSDQPQQVSSSGWEI